MSSYAKDMRQFRMNTPVSEALDHLPRNSDPPAGYSRLKAKLDFDVKTATLEDVDTYRKRFASDFALSQLALSLFDLQESSLLVTWLVPAAVGAVISDQVQKKSSSFFLINNILKLSLEGECLYPFMPMVKVSQSGTEGSGGAMIEAGASITCKPHQRIAERINRKPNHHGLAIVVPFRSLLDLTAVLAWKLRFAVYEPQDKTSLTSSMQAVDLELKHHPILVVVYGLREGNHLYTDIGHIDIKEDIMAPLFPPIATHLADKPKIFLFVVNSNSSERHAPLHFVEAIWENYIIGYIGCDYLRRAGDIVEKSPSMSVQNIFTSISHKLQPLHDVLRVADIVRDELAHPSMSVQEIFTSISDQLPSTVTMTVVDCLKEPVYLHPRGSELMETHSRSQESSEESDTLSRLGGLSTAEQSHLLEQPTKKLKTEVSPESSEKLQIDEDL